MTDRIESTKVVENLRDTYIYIEGVYQKLLSRATYNKYIGQKKEIQQYISVGL